MSLTGKVAIVTGGERGIGRGITAELLNRGMQVCIAGIDTDSARLTLTRLDAGDRLLFIETDVRNEESVRDMVGQAVSHFGGLDVVVANAGIANPSRTPVEKLSLEDWNRVIDTNLTGVFLCAKHAFPHLRKAKGSMVLVASTRALQSEADTAAYSASKGGVVALTHSLAISAGPDIRVNCISPGWIHTGRLEDLSESDHAQHPAGRVGHPGDISSLVAYLISEEAGFVTGQNFIVDGGMTRKMIYQE